MCRSEVAKKMLTMSTSVSRAASTSACFARARQQIRASRERAVTALTQAFS